jgi:hypothetical protein
MRVLPTAIAAAVLAGAWAGPAAAGPLVSASLTVSVDLAVLTFQAVGATGTATSDLAASLGAGSAFAGTETTTFTGTRAEKSPLDGVTIAIFSNEAGLFTGTTPGKVGGDAFISPSIYLTASDVPALRLPAFFGKQLTASLMGSGLGFTTFAVPWTAGAVTVTGIRALTPNNKLVTVTRMVTGANGLTPLGGGTLTLVSPAKVYVETGNRLPVIGTLTLNYVPEPGTLLLLGAGVTALASLGGRGRR